MPGWQDAPLVDEDRKQSWQSAPLVDDKEEQKRLAKQELLAGPRGVGKGLSGVAFDAASLPIRMLGRMWGQGEGADIAAEFGKEALSSRAPVVEPPAQPSALDKAINQYSPTLMTEYNVPEPETTTGRYLGTIGEAIGASLPFSAGTFAAARGLPALAASRPYIGPPTPTPPSQAERMLRPILERPGRFAGSEAAGAAGFGAAQQAASEADLPVPVQVAAGLVGGVAAPLGLAGTRSALSRLTTGEWGSETGALRIPRTWRQGGGEPPAPTPPAPGQLTPQWEKAYQQLADVGIRAGIPRDRIPDMLARWEEAVGGLHTSGRPPDQAALVDFAEAFAREAGSLRRQYTGAADVISGSIEARQRGYTDKPVAPGIQTVAGDQYTTPYTKEVYTKKGIDAGQHARLMEDEQRAFRIYDEPYHGFGKSADATAEMITADREQAAKPLWGNVRMAGRGVDLSKERYPSMVLAHFQKIADAPGLPPDIKAGLEKALKQYAPEGQLTNITNATLARKTVGDQIAGYTSPTASNVQKELARYLTRLNQQMTTALSLIKTNNLGELFAKANSAFREKSHELRMIKLGQDIYHGEAPVTAFDVHRGDRDSQKLIKLGFHGETRRESAGKRRSIDRTAMFDSPEQQEKRAFLIERSETDVRADPTRVRDPVTGELVRPGFDRPEHFGELVEGERRMIQTRDTARGGSQTALNQADDAVAQAVDTLHGLTDVFKGSTGAISAAKRLAELVYTRVMGPGADVADIKAQILFTADPVARRRHLAQIEMRMGKTRFQRWAEMIGDAFARQPRRLTGGVIEGTQGE